MSENMPCFCFKYQIQKLIFIQKQNKIFSCVSRPDTVALTSWHFCLFCVAVAVERKLLVCLFKTTTSRKTKTFCEENNCKNLSLNCNFAKKRSQKLKEHVCSWKLFEAEVLEAIIVESRKQRCDGSSNNNLVAKCNNKLLSG